MRRRAPKWPPPRRSTRACATSRRASATASTRSPRLTRSARSTRRPSGASSRPPRAPLRVEPRWERAVEGVLGPYLQSVIVPTPDDAVRGAAWLRATGAGRATFLVAGLRGGSEADETFAEVGERAAATLAEDSGADATEAGVRVADLLGTPREIGEVLRRTLAREMGARVAKGLEQAMTWTLPTGETCVTAEGEFVVGGQLIAAGGAAVAEEGAGLLAFKREMRELEVRVVGLSADLTFAEEAARRTRDRLAELEDAFVLLNDEIGREEREHVAREVSAQQLQHEIERAERHMRVVADDAARLADEQREIEERRAKQLADLEAAETARAAAQRAVAVAAEALATARRAAEAENESRRASTHGIGGRGASNAARAARGGSVRDGRARRGFAPLARRVGRVGGGGRGRARVP
ncbi:MAG: hypothetical protein DMF66_04540 [Acidobacteria bacterium]|nr:MAG: hypothetical protein DMF66_04540 [Acidobacteriota bacterium]